MNKILMFFLKMFRGSIEALGADFEQLCTILKYKLMLQNRKQFHAADNKKERNGTLWFQLFYFFMMGMMGGMSISLTKSLFLGMSVTFTLMMFLGVINLIAEFDTLFLDIRDVTIVMPRPVSERTYLMSRVIHILYYVMMQMIAFSIVPVVVVVVKFGVLSSLFFFIETILCVTFAVFITVLLYFGLMRMLSGEKFKNIISYVQILVTILFMGGYQFLNDFMRYIDKTKISPSYSMLFTYPPSWYANAMVFYIERSFTSLNLISLAISIFLPIMGIWLVFRYLTKDYLNKLAIYQQGDLQPEKERLNPSKIKLSGMLAKLFCRSSIERSAFFTMWRISARDRSFKMSVYPIVGYALVFVVIFGFKYLKLNDGTLDIKSTLLVLYFPVIMLYALLNSIRFSLDSKSSWIYSVMPLSQPGEIVSATYKVVLIKLYAPIFIIIALAGSYWGGIHFLPHVAVAFFTTVIPIVTIMLVFKLRMPFSEDKALGESGRNFIASIFSFALGGLSALIHYGFIWLNIPVIYSLIVWIPVLWAIFRGIRKAGWEDVKMGGGF